MGILSGNRCHMCGKGRVFGRSISHSGTRTPRIFRANLHWKHILLDGVNTRVRLCTKCIKRLKKNASDRVAQPTPVAQPPVVTAQPVTA